jgi:glycosyltransferase involved in cell wall biosynthesis
MQVTISVGGRFHAFYLALQLLKQGYLKKLITSYPKFEVANYGIPRDKVTSVIIKELMGRGWQRLPSGFRKTYNPQYLIHEIYDKWASSIYGKSDICIAWSSFNILREEYEELGIKPQLAHPEIIEKELQEYKEADYISIPSLFARRTFLERGISEEKLIHVPYGVYLDEFNQIPKEDAVFRIIYVGAMSIQKGIHYLLKAFSDLNLNNAELLLIGSIADEIKPFFKKYEGHYKWIGSMPQKKLYKYYSQGSVFVIMSIQEGVAMVQSQAMACGLPVICTTNTGGEDIIRDAKDGFIIPIREVEALKDKMLYLYENPGIWKEMGQSAKQRVSNGFTWDDYGTKMIEAYKQCLQNKTSNNNVQHNS